MILLRMVPRWHGLRAQVLEGDYPNHPAAADAGQVLECIRFIDVDDMPPPPELTAILIEALSQRLGGVGYDKAWRSIGINPASGRDLLRRQARAVTWPVWRTLRDAALLQGT